MKSVKLLAALLLFIPILFTSCEKDDIQTQPLEAKTAEILVDAKATGAFSYFSFASGSTITTNIQNWDFGLRLVSFIVNSGVSGSGNAGVIVQSGVFDDIKSAPETGYLQDSANQLAVKDGEWYDYNAVARSFVPKAGIVFIFRTNDGKFAKMEVLKADPADNDGKIVTPPTIPTKIKYTIRYVYQPDGTRNF